MRQLPFSFFGPANSNEVIRIVVHVFFELDLRIVLCYIVTQKEAP